MSYDEDNEYFTCPWPWCNCTHVGCVSGWIERVRPDGTEYAAPCPTCRPEVSRHLADRRRPLSKLRRDLPALARPTRTRRPLDGAA